MVRILFLEDEPTIQEVLTEYMKMQHYEVIPASDGEQTQVKAFNLYADD